MTTLALADRRLRHLYEISTLLTGFAGIDATLPRVVDVAARALPVRTAALVVETEGGLQTHVWKTDEVDAAATAAALEHARDVHAWFANGSPRGEQGTPPPSIRALPAVTTTANAVAAPSAARFVVLPLVVERSRVFGVLQVEGATSLAEADVSFVNAVANQVAVAIHRQMAIDAAEARVRAQLDFTRAITGSLGEGVVATDAAGRVSFMNPAAEQMLGCSERAVLGRPAVDVIRARRADDGTAVECPLTRALAGETRVAGDDDAFVTEDGRLVPFSYVAAPITTGAVTAGAVLAFRDVVAAKRSERTQRLLSECSAALGSSLVPEVMIEALERVLVPELADVCHVETVIRAPLASERAIVVPLRARDRSFGALTVGLTGSGRAFSDEDRAVVEEIARRTAIALEHARLHAQLEKAVRDREEILAVVSHDLRSPLSTIMMAVGSFRERARHVGDAAARDTVEMIGRAADRMSRLTRDLLDVSSIEANRLAIDPAPTRTSQIAHDLVEALEPTARKKQLALTVTQPDTALVAWCDADRIVQALTNVVGNAIKFTPAGGRIDITIEAAGECVRFFVHDTGAGIAPELLPHVFERHSQAPETAAKGRGLGLFITKGIVDAHGGRIIVSSERGVGTTFELLIPRASPPLAATKPQDPALVSGQRSA